MSNNHDYHLVDPSPWPLLGSVSAFVLVLGTLFYLHPSTFPSISQFAEGAGVWLLVPGLLGVLLTMVLWWRDVIIEAFQGFHKPVVQLGLRYGMVLFIASEVLFFAAFFWSYFNSAIPAEVFPPADVEVFSAWGLPFLNTVILLLSSTTVTWAHHSICENDRRGLIIGLILTLLLGCVFLGVQVFEYAHATFAFTSGNYATNFYMPTGFHGAHVFIGSVFLAVCLFRAIKGHFSPTQHFGLEAAAWYWHFVDVVWLFLFVCVYWWGGK